MSFTKPGPSVGANGKDQHPLLMVVMILIDTLCLVGPPDVVRERLAVYRDAGVGTLIVSPMAFETEQRKRTIRELAEML